MNAFLNTHGWSVVQAIDGDVSPRRYARVEKNGRTALLMDCRKELPDRPGMAEFVRLSMWLRGEGIRTPEIYEVDETAKMVLLEDFGDTSFRKALDQGVSEAELYELAVDVLGHLRTITPPDDLPRYHDTRIHALRRDLIDWWLPAVRGQDNPAGLTDAFLTVWDDIEAGLPEIDHGFLHMDYHLENLMFMPDASGLARCGLIDFQDASVGPVPYDLANLLENVRRSVPDQIKSRILTRYDEAYLLWYRVLATQWHGRVLGLFTRLAVRDGRPQYLEHMPRIYAYMDEALKHPVLSPLKVFLDDLGVDFKNIQKIEGI